MFTVEPERQAELVELWTRSTEEYVRHLPGFISANVHASHDGRRVVNYAQWESEAHFQAALNDPEAQKHFAELGRLAVSMDPHLYTVESVHHS